MVLHRLSFCLAVAAAFGGNGVTAYPHHASRTMHNAFAALCVLGGLLHFSIEVRLCRTFLTDSLGNELVWAVLLKEDTR